MAAYYNEIDTKAAAWLIAELRLRAAKLRDTREALIPNDTANPI